SVVAMGRQKTQAAQVADWLGPTIDMAFGDAARAEAHDPPRRAVSGRYHLAKAPIHYSGSKVAGLTPEGDGGPPLHRCLGQHVTQVGVIGGRGQLKPIPAHAVAPTQRLSEKGSDPLPRISHFRPDSLCKPRGLTPFRTASQKARRPGAILAADQ